MAGSTRAYTAGKYLLELEGQVGGFLRAVEGGEAFASVIEEAPADTAVNVVRKHLGAMAYAPIQMSVGSGMSNPFYQWMMDWLAGKRIAMSGAIVFLDYNFTEKSRLEFKNAMIVEVGFPALDAASKEFLFFKVTLAPESTRFSQAAAGAGKLSFGAKVKVLKAANFRLKINGVPVTRVNKIDALTVQQGLGAGEAGRMQVPNLAFTVPASDATEWFTWFDDFAIQGNNAERDERGGTIEILTADLKTAAMTLTLSNLGIIRVHRERVEADAEVIARVRVESYVERIEFKIDAGVAGVPAKAATVAPPAATPPLEKEKAPVEAQTIADRLRATARSKAASGSKRDEGSDIGTRWATERATLGELEQIAALETRDWSAVRLADDHSLIALLVEVGVLPTGGDSALDLERDNFVEGIVAGASQVLRNAAPHLKGSLV